MVEEEYLSVNAGGIHLKISSMIWGHDLKVIPLKEKIITVITSR